MEVATTIGVSENAVWNWEHGTKPELIHIPAILAFLGYIPWEDPVGRLAHFKKVNGLSYVRLGAVMERDPEQLEDWLSGRVKACKRNVQQILQFLTAQT